MNESSKQNPHETVPVLFRGNIATNSLLSLGTMLSGFIIQVLTAKYFGASPDMDAFLVAFLLLSFLITQLQSGGILATTYIPSFNCAIREDTNEARVFFTTAILVMSLVAICCSFFCFLLATEIVHFLGEGLSPETTDLGVRIFRILSFLFLPLVLSALFSASLRAEGRFFAAAFGPVAINCCIVVSLVFIVPGAGIMGYVWGWTFGLLIQCIIVMRPLIAWPTIGLRLLPWRDPNLRVFVNTTAILFFDALSGLLLLAVERNMASALAPGTVSHLNYAKSLYTVPLRLVVSPAQVVMFSLFAQHFASGRTDELKRVSASAIRLVVFLMLPTSLFIMCFSRDIVQLVYEHGRFAAQDTEATATLLAFYTLSIPAVALWWQLRMISFALRNVTFPFAAGILALILFFIGSRMLLASLGASSLALSWATAYYAASIVLGISLAYRYDIPIIGSLVMPLLRLSPAVLAAFGCISVLQKLSLVPDSAEYGSWVRASRVAIYGTAGLTTYIAVAWAAGVEEVKTVSAMSCDLLRKLFSFLMIRSLR